jgi:hypothetical protein
MVAISLVVQVITAIVIPSSTGMVNIAWLAKEQGLEPIAD